MPKEYDSKISYNYKFKAIPYSAIDNPAMGSEFSDSILTYILTFFCYKIVESNYRKIDKDYIIDYFESLYKSEVGNNTEKLFNFLSEKPNSYKDYISNLNHFKNKYNEKFELEKSDFEIIIKKILTLNIDYYSKCKNISFNDLLLYRNVKNFVCFTGTAYIEPPVDYTHGSDHDINFNPSNYIAYSNLKSYETVLDAIKSIINNNKIITNIYINKLILIDDIFSCLNNYEVLIDIGGIFIKYDINLFINEYKKLENKKDYIVYFDNGRKIYNLLTDQFANDDSITHSNAFYYFSNKNITGVDAKNIMNPKARGLITITNKTIMRDFSQGIFRMRNILEGQTCDIIFNNKFKNIMKGGCFEKITTTTIRNTIINNLIAQQLIIDKQKKKVLIKQNILALNKEISRPDLNKQILYLDPMTELYNESVKKFNEYFKNNKKFDIDSLNIINLSPKNKFLNDLIDKYLKFNIDIIENKQNIVEEQVEQQVEEQVEQQSINMPYDISKINNKGIVRYNLSYFNFDSKINIENDMILVACIFKKLFVFNDITIYDILLIYDNINNNLVIININNLTNFLIYNENINNRYTIISLYNKSYYGKIIDEELLKYLIIICSNVLNVIYNKYYIDLNNINLDKIIQDLSNIKNNDSFNFSKILKLTFINTRKGDKIGDEIGDENYLSKYSNEEAINTKIIYSNKLNDNELNDNKLNDNELNYNELNYNELNYNELNDNELNYNELNDNEFYSKYIKYKLKYLNLKHKHVYN
jgi:hypothetical protein